MKVAELFAEIGFDIDNEALGGLVGNLRGIAGKMTLVVGAAAAATFAIKKFTDASIKAATAMRSFRAETGLSIDELQQWQTVTQLTDASATAESVRSSIQALQSNLAQIRLGGGNIRPFQLLGIDIQGADAFDVLDQLRDRLRGVDRATAVNLLQEMGLDSSFIQVLEKTNTEFDRLANQYILSDEQQEDISDLATAFTDLGLYIEYVKNEIVAFISPALIKGVEAIKTAIRLLIAPFQALAMVGEKVSSVFSYLDRLIGGAASESFKKFTDVIKGLAAVFVAIKAPIVALLLLIEDIVVGLQGGNSVILMGLRKLSEAMTNAFKPVADFIDKYIVQPIERVMNMIKSDEGTPLMSGKNKSGFTVGQMRDLIKSESNPAPDSGFFGAAKNIGTSISNMFNNVFNIQTDNPQAAAQAITESMQTQLNYGLSDLNNSGAY